MEPNSETEAEQAAPAASETPEAPVENAALAAEIPPVAGPGPAAAAETDADADDSESEEEGSSEPASPDDPLSQLVAEAQKHRLSPTDEERASKLLQETLL